MDDAYRSVDAENTGTNRAAWTLLILGGGLGERTHLWADAGSSVRFDRGVAIFGRRCGPDGNCDSPLFRWPQSNHHDCLPLSPLEASMGCPVADCWHLHRGWYDAGAMGVQTVAGGAEIRSKFWRVVKARKLRPHFGR